MISAGNGSYTLTLPLLEVGVFEAKCCFIPSDGAPIIWAQGANFEIKVESYSFDAGKYYVCLLATYTGNCREIDEIESELGSPDSEYINNEARLGYLTTIYNARVRAMKGKILGGDNDPPERLIVDAIDELRKRI